MPGSLQEQCGLVQTTTGGLQASGLTSGPQKIEPSLTRSPVSDVAKFATSLIPFALPDLRHRFAIRRFLAVPCEYGDLHGRAAWRGSSTTGTLHTTTFMAAIWPRATKSAWTTSPMRS